MSIWEKYRAQSFRDIGLKKDMLSVLERDKILEAMGKDALLDAEEYEEKLNVRRGLARLVGGFDLKKRDTSKLEDLIEKDGLENVKKSFLKTWQKDDDLPFFPEFIIQDDDALKDLQAKFEEAYRKCALDFLEKHLDRITAKSLVGAMRDGVFKLTFDHMLN